MAKDSGALSEIIRSRIRAVGRITFEEFMAMALYYPGLGYYTSGRDRVGARGDFYTSPTTHPLFAALIGVQLEQMWGSLGSPREFTAVEMGAGKGLLAWDIVRYLPHLSHGFSASLRYVTLEKDGPPFQVWPETRTVLSPAGTTGCVLSNELLDAMPVHRVAMRDGSLLEAYVTLQDGEFAEVLDAPSTPELERCLADEGVTLTEGYHTEINLNIGPWMNQVSQMLSRGFLLTIDYGYVAPERYAAARAQGSLVTYYRHTTGTDPYLRVGEQDITTHVDFSAVVRAGQAEGLDFLGLVTQRDFLMNLGLDSCLDTLGKQLPYQEYLANRMAMLELVRPGGFGDFKVLVQSRGISACELLGLTPDNGLKKALREGRQSVHVPKLDQEHIRLATAKYPEMTVNEDIW